LYSEGKEKEIQASDGVLGDDGTLDRNKGTVLVGERADLPSKGEKKKG